MPGLRRHGVFWLGKNVGRGRRADVYAAYEQRSEGIAQAVAVHHIRNPAVSGPGSLHALRREVELGGALSHPNLAPAHKVAIEGRDLFLLAEYVDGHTLRELVNRAVQRDTRLSATAVIRVVAEAAAGLHHMHAGSAPGSSLVHADVSPGNIMISRDGLVKLIDFGRAVPVGSCAAGQGGKPGYMPPEEREGQPLTPASDVFRLGVVLWELLAWRRWPTRSDEANLPSLQALAPTCPPALVAVVSKATALRPDQRYGSAQELERALLDVADSQRLSLSAETLASEARRVRHGQPPAGCGRDGLGDDDRPTSDPATMAVVTALAVAGFGIFALLA